MAKRKNTVGVSKYKDFLVVMSCACALEQERQLEILKGARCPAMLGGKEVPQNLEGITFGQLDDIGRLAEGEDPAVKSLRVIMGFSDAEIYEMNVFDVFGFAQMCANEYKRIGGLFSSLKVHYNPDELQAGINEMNFGTFGVADWYARRMGITNQNDVYDIAWVRIYQCMRMDIDSNNYERKLNQVVNERIKTRKRR